MIDLRPYQDMAVEELRRLIRQGWRRLLLQAETGSGKTVVAAELMRLTYEKGLHALFIAHRRELVLQCSRRLSEHGVPHGLIMSRKPLTAARIQVASKDTLLEWAVRGSEIELPSAQLVIADEAHLSLAPQWQSLLRHYHDAIVVGLTATPATANGRGLGHYYQGMHSAVPAEQLIADGYLVPTRVFCPHRPDLHSLPRSGYDYNQEACNRLMDQPQLVGDVIRFWKRLAVNRLTIVFASGVSHSIHLQEAFAEAGVRAAHIDGQTHLDDRAKVLQALESGQIQVVCNVGVLPEGVDVPPVSCAVLARPTRSFVLFRQMAGRIKRPYPGKHDALLIDHAGAVFLHGFPDRNVEWKLDAQERVKEPGQRQPGEPEPLVCPSCFYTFSGTNVCPQCGHQLKRQARQVRKKDDVLQEVSAAEVDAFRLRNTREAEVRYWHRCLAVMAHKGQMVAAAAAMFRSRFKKGPGRDFPNMPQEGEWRMPVAILFPHYINRKPKAANRE